jgi:MoxR-like ATPase
VSNTPIKLVTGDDAEGDATEQMTNEVDHAAAERARAALDELEAELNAQYAERDETAKCMLTALVARQNMLMLGPPGTGKSALGRGMTSAIAGFYFDYLFTEFTDPGELFGPFSMRGLQNDRYERVTDGRLPTCLVAFLDEIFKANSAILNTLLTVINERKFHNGGQVIDVPMRMMLCASNEVPEHGGPLDALVDRILVRRYVGDIEDDDAFADVMWNPRKSINTRLSLDDVDALYRVSQTLPVTDTAKEAIAKIRRGLKEKGIPCSPRRFVQMGTYLRAHAARKRMSEVNTACLMPMVDCLWTSLEQRKTVFDLVESHAASWMRDVQRIRGELDEQAQRTRDLAANSALDTAGLFSVGGAIVERLQTIAKDITTLMGNSDAAGEATKLAQLESRYRRDALDVMKRRA